MNFKSLNCHGGYRRWLPTGLERSDVVANIVQVVVDLVHFLVDPVQLIRHLTHKSGLVLEDLVEPSLESLDGGRVLLPKRIDIFCCRC